MDMKIADVIHFLQPDTFDRFTALDLAVKARKLSVEAIKEALQYE